MTPTDLREELQHTLGDAYRIERELTPGGMSRLFLATERSLDRRVVIKLLPPEYASEVSAARFQREITVTAHLQHPHILPILSAGSKDGLLYYIMPYVDGESLRHRLAREGRLPVADAVRILREVADALARAHRAGIVHRDIKPENILLQDDHALLADFGVARALFQATGGERLTETGMGIGTPEYMAPEQLAGDRHVDGRADVYALAVVGYEMLAGSPPFAGATPQAVAAAHFTAPPEPLAQVRPEVSGAVSHAIAHALAKEPSERFASASDFRDALADVDRPAAQKSHALRWAAGALLGVIVVGAGFQIWRATHGAVSRDGNGAIRIAVLPFENLGDSADNYFADGVTDEVRGKLATLPGLEVISSASSNQYRRTTKPQDEIGRELRVRYLLVGRVRWDKPSSGASRVRVEPELVQVADVGSPTNRWQAPFDAPLTDVFQVQSDIARQVASALQVTLTPAAQQTLAARPTQNLDAYVAFLRGEEASQKGDDPANQRRMIEAYRQAITLDSTFALAWARLSRAYASLSGMAPAEATYDSARIAAERAMRLAPDLPEALAAMSFYYEFVQDDYARALTLDSTALERAPNNVALLVDMAWAEAYVGRPVEARLGLLERATILDPRFAFAFYTLGGTYTYHRRCQEARAPLDRALALQPANLQFLQGRTNASLCEGDLAGARAVLHAVPPTVNATELVAYYAANGGLDDFGWVLDSAQERLLLSLRPSAFDNDRGTWALALAQQYAFRGDDARSRAYADTALPVLVAEVKRAPENSVYASGPHMSLGLALAYLGQKDRAVREGERGLALLSAAKDPVVGPWNQEVLAQIYVRVGEQQKALELLESLLRMPNPFTPAWLRIDPHYARLRGNPRFEKLIASPTAGRS